jgi:tetratricopeptide (TPR) repeat protein
VFPVGDGPSRPINPERDLATNPMDHDTLQLALADLLNDRSVVAYDAMLNDKSHIAEANEGLALLAIRRKDTAAARDYLARSIEAGSKNASTLVEYARMENDAAKSKAALEKAVQFDPNSAEAHFLLGEKLTDLRERAQQWMAATRLAPQNAEWWAALAKCWLDQQQYAEAAKAWRAAEQSATTSAEREKMHAGRMAVEGQRLDYEESERKRIADERARDIQRLKAKAIADLRAAEARANGTPLPDDAASKAVPWWEGPKPEGHATGTLKQVDCLGRQFRITIVRENQKLMKLLVRDPGQLVVSGTGDLTLACGPQKTRQAIVEYFPKVNAKLGTAGEVASIEFH